MLAAAATPEHSKTLAFRDGLGDRFVSSDNAVGVPVQVLRLRPEMTEVPAFEFALRERTARLAAFRQEAYARIYRVHRMPAPARDLAMISEHVEGLRLSALLRVAEQHQVSIDLSTALSVIRQLLQATSQLHGHAPDLTNGLIAPERLIVTPRARVTIVEQALCLAIEQLHYSPERLWRELRIAAGTGAVRFSHRTDVMGIGLVALALVLGRPLRDEEFPHALPGLLDAAREHSTLGSERPLSPPLRNWMTCALQLDSNRSFASAPDAWRAFEEVVEADPLYLSVPMALERFLYSCTAALIEPSRLASFEAGPLPPAQSYAQRPAAPQPILAAEAPAQLATEPEIRVEMLPPPSIGNAPAPSESGSDPIDWSALAARPWSVVTARDIKQLFNDKGPPSFDGDAEQVDLSDAASQPSELVPSAGEAALGCVPEAAVAVTPEPERHVLPVPTPPRMSATSWAERAAPLTPSPRWRRVVIAAAIACILSGAVALSRFLRPEVVAASETGTVVVESHPEGLQVLIDGTDQGRTPVRLSVAAGDHLLEVRGGRTPRILPITVAGGAEVAHYIESEPQAPLQSEAAPAAAAAAPPDGSVAPALTSATPTWGWLDVKAESPMEIRAGGRVLGRTGGERIRLAEGRHQIELVNGDTGYRAVRVVHVVGGKVTNLAVPTPANGVVNVNASPWAEVWIDGRRVGETPLANLSVPLGSHEVVFRHPEFGEKRQAISVTAGAPVRISVDMK
jgi:hypothetical protein